MFSDRISVFNRQLHLSAKLPDGIALMNPFAEEGSVALKFSDAFYSKYYADDHLRIPILGINPGRHGAALSGVPFTDFKRLRDVCGIDVAGHSAHEPSSEFIYAMIAATGGPKAFYNRFYINSVCPLGFIRQNARGTWVNYNYYDEQALFKATAPFIIKSVKQQIGLGLHTDECFILGKKNLQFFSRLNDEHCFFGKLTELTHPRYIIQYRRKEMALFIEEYRRKLGFKAAAS